MERFSKAALLLMVALLSHVSLGGYLSLQECKTKAAEGDAEATFQLAVRYENGDGVRKDKMKALANYRKAASKNHCRACTTLAEMYEQGRLVEKDPVQAAKYRAKATGMNESVAKAVAKETSERAQIDEIEVALDYILGRNGKTKDPKAGIRILYNQAKDNPVAQRVFVQRWLKGDLGDGLSQLSDEELMLVLPWFKNAYDSGDRRCGLVLGISAHCNEEYNLAEAYWRDAGKAGMAKAWYHLARLYDPSVKLDNGGGPSCMHSQRKALDAYEACYRADKTFEDAWFQAGSLYLFGEKGVYNSRCALNVFSYFIKKDVEDKWILYCYGLAGWFCEEDEFERCYPKRVQEEIRLGAGARRGGHDVRYLRMVRAHDDMVRRQEKYVECIRRASRKGLDLATKFLENLNE